MLRSIDESLSVNDQKGKSKKEIDKPKTFEPVPEKDLKSIPVSRSKMNHSIFLNRITFDPSVFVTSP